MKPAPTLALAALAVGLGGCQSLVDAFGFARTSSASTYQIGQADLDEGRAHLRAGRVGNAIAPLHRAALNPQTSGDALNALGVAYTKLGRADLAERYFMAAVKTDRTNERYAANLDRFYRSDLSRDARLLHAQRERAQESFADYTRNAPEKPFEEEPDTRLVQSGGKTHSITVSGPRPSPRVSTGTQTARVSKPADYPVGVRFSGGVVRPNTGTVRPAEISIGSRTSTPASAPRVRVGSGSATPGYPVRVRIPSRPNSTSDE